ncbi:unnamed protein product [Closterium sp. NIES-64]|nr:unnamed protein product [Closterium sp. NIES-64]
MQSQPQQPSSPTDTQDTAAPTTMHPAAPAGQADSPSASHLQDNPPAAPPLPGPAVPTPPEQPQPDSTPPSATPSTTPAQGAAVAAVAEQAAPAPSAPLSSPDHPSTAPPFPFDPLAPSAPSFQHLPFLSAALAQQQQQQLGVNAPLLGPRQAGAGGAFGAFQEPPRVQKRSTMRLLLSMQQLVLAAQATTPVRLAVALLLALLYCLRMLPLHCPHLTHWLPGLTASAGAGTEAPEGLTATAAGLNEASLSSPPSLLSFLFFLPAHPCLTVLATDAALIASSLLLQTFISPRHAAASPAGLAGLLQGLTAAARQSEGEIGGAGAAGASPLSEMMGMMERTGYWMARAGMVRDVLHGLLLNLSVFLVALGCAVAAAEAAGQGPMCAAVEWGVEGAVRRGGGLLELWQVTLEGAQDWWTAVF